MTSISNQEPVTHRKLKGIFINTKFQLTFICCFTLTFLVATFSSYATTFLFYWKFKSKALKVGIPAEHVFFKFLQDQKHELDLLFIGLAAVNLFLLFIVSLIISHRIAGPISKLKNYLKSLDKDSENFKLRSNDFFQDLEPVINDLKNKIK